MQSKTFPFSNQSNTRRILLVTETLDIGGAELSIINILPALIRKGYECEVACLRPPYTYAKEIEQMGVTVHRMNLSFFWNIPEGVSKLSLLLWKKSYDILYGYVFFPTIYLAMSRLLSPKSFRVACFGCLEFERDNFHSPWMRLRKWFRISLMKYWMDGLLAVSNPILLHYRQYLGREDIVVVPNAVSSSAFDFIPKESRSVTREKYGVTDDDFVLITPARYIAEKGHTFMIDAVKILVSKQTSLKVLFFGYGELEQQLKIQVSKSGLKEVILFHPPLSQPDLFQAIYASDLFILPSTSEGFGLAIAEAAALGAAILATKVGGIPDVVEDEKSAILVPSKDSVALANAVLRLKNDTKLRLNLGTAARIRAQQKFNSDAVAEQMHRYFSAHLNSTKHKLSNLLLD